MKNKVSWNLFDKWYRDTRHRIVPVDVEGHPAEEEIHRKDMEAPECTDSDFRLSAPFREEIRIMVYIRMSNGMQIRQKI